LANTWLLLVLCFLTQCVSLRQKEVKDDPSAKWRDRRTISDPENLKDISRADCHFELDLVWKANIGSSVFSTPVITDLRGDGRKEIVITTSENYLEVLRAEDGHKAEGFPYAFAGSQFYSDPLLYDLTKDGREEIVVVSLSGEVGFIRGNGLSLHGAALKIPPLPVERRWFDNYEVPGTTLSKYLFSSDDNAPEMNSFRRSLLSLQQKQAPDDAYLELTKKRKLQQRSEQIEVKSSDLLNLTQSAPSSRKLLQFDSPDNEIGGNEGIWQGVEGWLPPEGVKSLELFLPTDTPENYLGQVKRGGDPFYSLQYQTLLQDFRKDPKYVYVDAHVLTTPVIGDIDKDGNDDIVLTVSYYFDSRDGASRWRKDNVHHPDKYVAGGIVVFDLVTKKLKFTKEFELTTDHTLYRGHIYSSPTLVDVEGNGFLDIVVTTAAGGIYVVDHTGKMNFNGFPQLMDGIYTSALAEDLNGDGQLELIFLDIKSTIACFSVNGEEMWETRFSGIVSQPPAIGDINGDGVLDIVFTSDKGHLWAISGDGGKIIEGFPIDLGSGSYSSATLIPSPDTDRLLIIQPTSNGLLHIVDPIHACLDSIDTAHNTVSQVLVDDLTGNGKLDLIVTLATGIVMCFATEVPYHPLRTWTHGEGFRQKEEWHGIYVTQDSREMRDITGDSFDIEFEIVDTRGYALTPDADPPLYLVNFFLNSQKVGSQTYNWPGMYSITLPAPDKQEKEAKVILEMFNDYQQKLTDSFHVTFNLGITKIIKWVLVLPFFVSALVLIFIKNINSTPLPN